jgi:hypothetical protein
MALLALVVLAALGVRLYVVSRAAMISRDGATFIWYAQGLERDPLGEIRRQRQHPLYPAMVLEAHRVVAGLGKAMPGRAALNDPVLSWEIAGIGVTLLGGLAAVVGVYALTMSLFGPKVETAALSPQLSAISQTELSEPEAPARSIALVAAALAAGAAEFCQLSADVLTDMPHLAIYLFSLALGISGLRRRSYGRLLACGALSGIAYLIRPEGAEPAVAVAVVALFGTHWPAGARLKACVAVAVAGLVFAGPYMLATGKLVQKKAIGQLVAKVEPHVVPNVETHVQELASPEREARGSTHAAHPLASRSGLADTRNIEESKRQKVETAAFSSQLSALSRKAGSARPTASEEPDNHRTRRAPGELAIAGFGLASGGHTLVAPLRALGLIVEDYVRCLRVTLLIPAAVWLVMRRRRPRELQAAGEFAAAALGLRVLLAAALLHLAIAVLLIIRFDYWELFSIRHVVVLAAMTLPASAAGVLMIANLIRSRHRSLVLAAMLAVLIGPTSKYMLEARFADEAYLRRAGEWVRAQQPPGSPAWTTRVLTTRNQVALYANGVLLWGPLDADFGRYLAEARANRPDWVVFDERRLLKMSPTFFADLMRAARPGELVEAQRVEQPSRRGVERAIVYRYNP